MTIAICEILLTSKKMIVQITGGEIVLEKLCFRGQMDLLLFLLHIMAEVTIEFSSLMILRDFKSGFDFTNQKFMAAV